MSRVDLLTATLDGTYARVRRRVDGLGDVEFFWQPVPDCWTIFQDASGRWTYDYAIPDPDPAPVTTIAWQVVHLWTCEVTYHGWAFGLARLTFPELDIPHTAASAIARLDEGQELLRTALQGLTESQLDEPVKTNWGEQWPAWRIFLVMADHDAFHGGMIGACRDLYNWTHQGAARM